MTKGSAEETVYTPQPVTSLDANGYSNTGGILSAGEFSYANHGLVTVCDADLPILRLFLFMIHSPEKVEGRQCGFTLLLNTVIQIPTPGMSLIKHRLRGKTRLSHGPEKGKKNNSQHELNCLICLESF